jgi:hypothetical protein
VSQARVDVQLGPPQSVNGLAEKIDAGKLIAITRKHQGRTGDLAPVVNSQLLGVAGAVERVAQQDQAGRFGLGSDHARHPAPERMAPDHRVRKVCSYLIA